MKFRSRFALQMGFFCLLALFSNCSRTPNASKTGAQETPATENNAANSTQTPSTQTPVTPPAPTSNEPTNMAPHPTEPAQESKSTPSGPPTNSNQLAQGPILHILAPVGHLPSWLTDLAQAKLGGKIDVTTYSTDAEFREKLATPENKFDLVGVTDRVIPDLIKNGALLELPQTLKNQLPHAQVKFLHHYFDEENVFTYPYGCTLLGYVYTLPNPSLKDVKPALASSSKMDSHTSSSPSLQLMGGPKTWKDLEKSIHLVSWPADPSIKEACEHFLLSTKAQAETKQLTPAHITVDFISHLKAEIKAEAIATSIATPVSIPPLVPDLTLPPSPPPPTPLPSLPPALTAAPSLSVVVLPTDGSLITLYSWAIIKDTPHLDAAQNFLQMVNAPDNIARLATENDFAVTQTAAFKVLPPDTSKDLLLYPPDTVLDHCEFLRSKP